jgi:spore coat polysaccharide biosynthesis protein SpsF
MSQTDIIIQARMGSGRLPGKVLRDLVGFPMVYHVVERCRFAKCAANVIVATTTLLEDDAIVGACERFVIPYSRGSSENVLERYYDAARQYKSSVIVRVTADCPLIDPFIIDECVKKFYESEADYISNVSDKDASERTFPRGLDVEVFSFAALEKAYRNATEQYEKEHVTPYIWENKKNEFRIGSSVSASSEYARDYRLTVDYPEDFELMEIIYERFYKSGTIIFVPEVISFLSHNPEIAAININCEQRPVK